MSRSPVSCESKLVRAAPLFAALGDEIRLSIVSKLCLAGPQPIVRLTEGTQVSRQAVTKHLCRLARAGIVRSTRDGRERIWEIETKRLAEVRRHLDEISHQWDRALDRLRTMVEAPEPRK